MEYDYAVLKLSVRQSSGDEILRPVRCPTRPAVSPLWGREPAHVQVLRPVRRGTAYSPIACCCHCWPPEPALSPPRDTATGLHAAAPGREDPALAQRPGRGAPPCDCPVRRCGWLHAPSRAVRPGRGAPDYGPLL